jgi:L-threonylcarbamoyladenylate synthase
MNKHSSLLSDSGLITQAVQALRSHQLVAFPTETVYGLGAVARSAEAMARLYTLKGRPRQHPVIVHLPNADTIDEWASQVPKEALLLAEAFWPGPLTLILPKHPNVLAAVTGGKPTVGLRVPAHPVALALLQALGEGVAAPSANRFGRISPTTAAHVLDDFGAEAPLILDGGACPVGVESTIVDLSQSQPTLLRHGAIGVAALNEVLGRELLVTASLALTPQNSLASGTLASHYAPKALLKQVSAEQLHKIPSFAGLAVLSFTTKPALEPVHQPLLWLEGSPDPQVYTQAFYANLRKLDNVQGVMEIWVETLPQSENWQAVADRLNRASAPRGECLHPMG